MANSGGPGYWPRMIVASGGSDGKGLGTERREVWSAVLALGRGAGWSTIPEAA
jgi:hypothetical protein